MAIRSRKTQSKGKSEAKSEKKSKGTVMQFPASKGRQQEPKSPLPSQHQPRPGIEAKMEPKPRFEAPLYKGSGKLKDKVALITGGDSGIGRAVAVLFAREGADVAIAYLDADEDAEETKAAVEREGRRAMLIKGDVADPAFGPAAVEHTLQTLGGLDILVNNAAFQEHVTRFEDL